MLWEQDVVSSNLAVPTTLMDFSVRVIFLPTSTWEFFIPSRDLALFGKHRKRARCVDIYALFNNIRPR